MRHGPFWGLTPTIFVLSWLLGVAPVGATTVGTFFDPAIDGSTPLFAVDALQGTLKGGWADSRTGLVLQLPVSGPTPPGVEVYTDAWFTMTDLTYTGTLTGGTTGPGTIEFFADGANSPVLLRITFGSAQVRFNGFGGDNTFYASNNVQFSGLETTNWINVEDEMFAFSFTNQRLVPKAGGGYSGYTATASFTSSATINIPEPVTMLVLGAGIPLVFARRRA